MEEQKKRRRINFFDIVIVLVLLLAVAAAYLLTHRNDSPAAVVVPRTYQVELPELEEGIEQYVSVGDPVTDNIKNYGAGTVKSIEVRPCVTDVLDEETGVLRRSPVEGQITLVLTIEADTVETDKSIETTGGYTLRTGAGASLTAGSMSAAGYILAVSR